MKGIDENRMGIECLMVNLNQVCVNKINQTKTVLIRSTPLFKKQLYFLYCQFHLLEALPFRLQQDYKKQRLYTDGTGKIQVSAYDQAGFLIL